MRDIEKRGGRDFTGPQLGIPMVVHTGLVFGLAMGYSVMWVPVLCLCDAVAWISALLLYRLPLAHRDRWSTSDPRGKVV